MLQSREHPLQPCPWQQQQTYEELSRLAVAPGDAVRPEQLVRLERRLAVHFECQHLVELTLGGERQGQRLAEHLGFGDPKHGGLPGRARYVAEPARGQREPAERRFPALAPQADDDRVGAVAARPGRAYQKGVAAARGCAAPSFGEELGKLPEPPTKELAKHVPKPIPGFAPNRRASMLKSR